MTDGVASKPASQRQTARPRPEPSEDPVPEAPPADEQVSARELLATWAFGASPREDTFYTLYGKHAIVFGSRGLMWKDPEKVVKGEDGLLCQACSGKLHEVPPRPQQPQQQEGSPTPTIRVFGSCGHAYHRNKMCNFLGEPEDDDFRRPRVCPVCYPDEDVKVLQTSRLWEWMQKPHLADASLVKHFILGVGCLILFWVLDVLWRLESEDGMSEGAKQFSQDFTELLGAMYGLTALVTLMVLCTLLGTLPFKLRNVYKNKDTRLLHDDALTILIECIVCLASLLFIATRLLDAMSIMLCLSFIILIFLLLPENRHHRRESIMIFTVVFTKLLDGVFDDTRVALQILHQREKEAKLRRARLLLLDDGDDTNKYNIYEQRQNVIEEMEAEAKKVKYAQERVRTARVFRMLQEQDKKKEQEEEKKDVRVRPLPQE